MDKNPRQAAGTSEFPCTSLLSASALAVLSGAVLVLMLATTGLSYAGDQGESLNVQGKRKSMSAVLKTCSDREARTSEALAKLLDKLSGASQSEDPAKMKAALEETKAALSGLKSDHEKSRDALLRVQARLETLKKQIKTARKEHEKAANMIEDEDMDDIIWAY